MADFLDKSIAEYLGVKDIEDLDGFKKAFDEKFITRDGALHDKDLQSQIAGAAIGSITTKVVTDLKAQGIELPKDEIKDMKLEEVVGHGLKKINDLHSETQNNLQSEFDKFKETAAKPDEQVKEWEGKYQKLETSHNELKGLHDDLKKSHEDTISKHAGEVKNMRLDIVKDQALNGIKWKEGATDIEKKGFLAHINENYKFDLDENNKAIITNINGERIKSEKKVGEMMSIADVLEKEAIEAKVLQVNPHGGKPAPTPQPQAQKQTQQTDAPVRKVHPSAQV